MNYRKVLSFVVCTVRKSGPVIFNVDDKESIISFSSDDYRHVCTLKAAIFAGPFQEYVISGSDDFGICIHYYNQVILRVHTSGEYQQMKK